MGAFAALAGVPMGVGASAAPADVLTGVSASAVLADALIGVLTAGVGASAALAGVLMGVGGDASTDVRVRAGPGYWVHDALAYVPGLTLGALAYVLEGASTYATAGLFASVPGSGVPGTVGWSGSGRRGW